MGSPSAIITIGLGTWASVNEIITLGYGIAEEIVDAAPATIFVARRQLSVAKAVRGISRAVALRQTSVFRAEKGGEV